MFARPEGSDLAILVHIHFPKGQGMQEDLLEFQELVSSAGIQHLLLIQGNRKTPDAKYFVGAGKAEEIRLAIVQLQARLIVFNHALSPSQERNLEKLFQCRVLDRTGLILNIFAQRARSFEGKLQVELALLKHSSTRLIRGWTHLERQKGGIGLRGGPGETQLEIDRRLIRSRMQSVSQRLEKVRSQRAQSRRSRKKTTIPTIALVGYTNAGKSTLFNYLTGASVYTANKLFATLDPTLRRVHIPELGTVILADTVGFIRHLPHDLIDAFRATLEEVCEADLLLHVVDAHDEMRQANIQQVQTVLNQIGAGSVPNILVYNKIDLCPGVASQITYDSFNIRSIWLSAYTGDGVKELLQVLAHILMSASAE